MATFRPVSFYLKKMSIHNATITIKQQLYCYSDRKSRSIFLGTLRETKAMVWALIWFT